MFKKAGMLFSVGLLCAACGAPKDTYHYAIGHHETYKIVFNDVVIVPDGIVSKSESEPFLFGYMFPIEKWVCGELNDRPRFLLIDEETYFLLDTQSGNVDYFDNRHHFEARLESLSIDFDQDYSWFEMYRPITKYVDQIKSPETCQKHRLKPHEP